MRSEGVGGRPWQRALHGADIRELIGEVDTFDLVGPTWTGELGVRRQSAFTAKLVQKPSKRGVAVSVSLPVDVEWRQEPSGALKVTHVELDTSFYDAMRPVRAGAR